MTLTEQNTIDLFKRVNTDDLPDFYQFDKTLDRALWVLWVAKEKLDISKLTPKQIASVITSVKEVSCDDISVIRAFSRAEKKVYKTRVGNELLFEVMKSGKEYLLTQVKGSTVTVFHFEPGKKYTSKGILSKKILDELKGDLHIVDPYIGEGTLDVLQNVQSAKVITRLDNIQAQNQKERFLRALKDFQTENPKVEFRDYPNHDIHDRYIIASGHLVILGHSLKDLGSKDCFAIVLSSNSVKNLLQELTTSFNRRWKDSKRL